MVNDVSGEQVNSPSESLLNLGLLVAKVKLFASTSFTIMLLYLAVLATPFPFLILVAALDFPLSVRAICDPTVQQLKFTKRFIIIKAYAILMAFDGFLSALKSLVDVWRSIMWSWDIPVYFLIFSK